MTCTLTGDAHTIRRANGSTERGAELHIVLSSAQHAALLAELRAGAPDRPAEATSGLETVLHALLRVLAADEEAGQ
uniref:Uncharacterized protein n=1 Tax=viral metagenome TaxID=1070528 RepID=A0A6M3K308_9ZZZZ